MDTTQAEQQEQHSIYNGLIHRTPAIAKFFDSLLDKLENTFDGMPIDEILHLIFR